MNKHLVVRSIIKKFALRAYNNYEVLLIVSLLTLIQYVSEL